VEALVDTGAYVGYKKVQIQIRLRAKDFPRRTDALLRGQAIIDEAHENDFASDFISALNEASEKQDYVDFSRFNWMIPDYDLVLLSATGFPISDKDLNPDYQIDEGDQPATVDAAEAKGREDQLELILTGVVLAGLLMVGLMACMYFRLRRQYWDLEKDKGLPANLKAMWERCGY
jgi:hypothetical protein